MSMGGELHASMCKHPARDSVSQVVDLVERTETGAVIIKFPADINMVFRDLTRSDLSLL